jgi:hypothetical protein
MTKPAPSIDTKAGQRAALYALLVYIDTDPNPDLATIRATLYEVVQHMRNRPPIRRAPNSSVPLTDAVRQQIRTLHATQPTMTQKTMAEITGVNSGRVSETVSGKRG